MTMADQEDVNAAMEFVDPMDFSLHELESMMEEAPCLGMPIELFYPVKVEIKGKLTQTSTDDAEQICSSCPLSAPCLAIGLRTPPNYDYGYRGRTTPKERAKIRLEIFGPSTHSALRLDDYDWPGR